MTPSLDYASYGTHGMTAVGPCPARASRTGSCLPEPYSDAAQAAEAKLAAVETPTHSDFFRAASVWSKGW